MMAEYRGAMGGGRPRGSAGFCGLGFGGMLMCGMCLTTLVGGFLGYAAWVCTKGFGRDGPGSGKGVDIFTTEGPVCKALNPTGVKELERKRKLDKRTAAAVQRKAIAAERQRRAGTSGAKDAAAKRRARRAAAGKDPDGSSTVKVEVSDSGSESGDSDSEGATSGGGSKRSARAPRGL